ncbi:hypothetical protein BKA56DRAFT_99518 [Ilyonectria sp. MPI-CAGE-AT-0026]|nr:hypothetical protein BKA56DRAFT_99518 [Ilyonectria sp. MPI-CAGE-AT-0026]
MRGPPILVLFLLFLSLFSLSFLGEPCSRRGMPGYSPISRDKCLKCRLHVPRDSAPRIKDEHSGWGEQTKDRQIKRYRRYVTDGFSWATETAEDPNFAWMFMAATQVSPCHPASSACSSRSARLNGVGSLAPPPSCVGRVGFALVSSPRLLPCSLQSCNLLGY